jgi:hypothetical protein
MSNNEGRARATLDAWRDQHADRLDPIRFHFIEALQRRAAAHEGEARRVLDNRLGELIQTYADDLERATSGFEKADDPASLRLHTSGALGELIDRMTRRAASRGSDIEAGDEAPQPSAFPELAALDEFGKIWSQLRAESQLRQSLEQAPPNAGPLNSSALVHRSIALMRELSPGYLQQFLAYVDALSWMEQMNGSAVHGVPPRSTSGRRRAREKQ